MASLLISCQAAPPKRAVDHTDLMYFIMTDRFFDGDQSNNQEADRTNPLAYHGGDFQGIRDKLDYLQNLGVTMVWITPVQKNTPNGYHGYWIDDFYAIEERLGTLDELKALVQDMHRRGMKLIVDFVVNHSGYDSKILKEHPDWFHPNTSIHNWNDKTQVEKGWLAGLPDFDQSIPEVSDYLLGSALWLIEETGIDGFRLDTVRHVELAWWKTFTQAIKDKYPDFYLLGEVYDYNAPVLNYYKQSGMEGMLNYSLYRGIQEGLHQGGSMKGLAEALNWADKDPSWEKNGAFFDNHDNPRFISHVGDGAKEYLLQALTIVMTTRQIPVIYYGTEVSLEGFKDPDNRRDFPWDTPDNTLEPLWSFLLKLHQDEIYRLGSLRLVQVSDEVLVYEIVHESERFLIALNNENQPKTLSDIDLSDLVNFLDPQGSVSETLEPRSVTIYRSK